jgi:hypothetical protein
MCECLGADDDVGDALWGETARDVSNALVDDLGELLDGERSAG